MRPSPFKDRREAGRALVGMLAGYVGRPDVVVLGLPRGGVPVAFEIASALGVSMDVFVVRKLGVPGREELAVGAIATGGTRYVNQPLADRLGLTDRIIDQVSQREQLELDRRDELYRRGALPVTVSGKIAILVDDGLATGATMRAAVEALRLQEPAKIVVAVPVASPDVCRDFSLIADEIVCAITPSNMTAVGLWYEEFGQTSDREVQELLQAAREAGPS